MELCCWNCVVPAPHSGWAERAQWCSRPSSHVGSFMFLGGLQLRGMTYLD